MARGRLRSTVSSAGSAPRSRRCHFFTIELPPGDVGTLFVVGKLSSQPVTHYRIVAVVALLLSLGAPLAAGAGFMPGASADAVTVMTLMVMHVIGQPSLFLCLPRWQLRSKAGTNLGHNP